MNNTYGEFQGTDLDPNLDFVVERRISVHRAGKRKRFLGRQVREMICQDPCSGRRCVRQDNADAAIAG